MVWVFSVLAYEQWRFGEDTLSELGGDVPSRHIFNSGVIITGLLSIPFAVSLRMALYSSRLGRAGGYALLSASIGLISVGLFPIDTGDAHAAATVLFFGSIVISAFLLVTPLAKFSGRRGIPFLCTVCLIVISLLFLALTPIPLAEAVTVGGLLVWAFIMGLWILRGNDIRDGEQNSNMRDTK